jgi:NRE family putative nickel resistance protein-like MFS transporter
MILCDGRQAITVGLIAVLLPPFPVFVGLLAVAGAVGTLFLPASKSAVPKLVERARMGRANVLLGASRNVAVAVGPVVSAFVYQTAGARAALTPCHTSLRRCC